MRKMNDRNRTFLLLPHFVGYLRTCIYHFRKEKILIRSSLSIRVRTFFLLKNPSKITFPTL